MGQFGMLPEQGAVGTGRRIYELMRAQMADGTFPTGGRMPSTRAIATELGVSRTTVTAAYEQLASEGFIITAAGKAARVASPPSALAASRPPMARKENPDLSAYGRRVSVIGTHVLPKADPRRIDFLYGALAARDFPVLLWRRAYQTELLRQKERLFYLPPEGDEALRHAIQGYVRRARGLICNAEQILIVSGTQQAIDLCARLLLDPGDEILFEDPGYLIARHCFEAVGAKVLPAPVDEQGLDTGCLPHDKRVRLAYVTPSHQFPLGGVLPISRRLALLEWAQRHRTWILEDDYDGEFRYGQRPIDALQSIDSSGRVLYVGTFSKALSPHLRLGYMILPAELVAVFRQAKRLGDRHAPVLEQRVLASLIESGAYERHVRRVRREYERRRAVLLEAIAHYLPTSVEVAGTAAGLHLLLWLPFLRWDDEPSLVTAALELGVGVYSVSPLFADPQRLTVNRVAGLILGYASLTPDEIRKGISALAKAITAVVGVRAPG